MARAVCLAMALAPALMSGCYSHRVATGPVSYNHSVRVRFVEPREVRLMLGGESRAVSGVRELKGTVLRQRADSLWLVVRWVGTADPFDASGTVLVQRTAGTTVEIRRYSVVRTAAAVATGGFVGFVIGVLVVVSALE